MKVFKFGGASVRNADGIRNLVRIVRAESDRVFIIVSAMGKTTNALEKVVEHFVRGETRNAVEAIEVSRSYHQLIVTDLFGRDYRSDGLERYFGRLSEIVLSEKPADKDYDYWYDLIVSTGELVSTSIISEFLAVDGIPNRWIDMRKVYITDCRHRDADINTEISGPLIRKELCDCQERVLIGQGFIGATPNAETTTLGREGSDYSAAMAAYLIDAESVTIWKDVPGILSADPKFFADTTFIPEMTYLDAIELAYSGAQIIHPKTIKPLQNRNIPLYVRPFGNPGGTGSVIKAETAEPVTTPILILKQGQVLISIRPNDFSFVLEDRFAEIFAMLERCRVKINLIQSSAVNLSICVDESRRLTEVVDMLTGEGYRVLYNEGLELLTIRRYSTELLDRFSQEKGVLLTQRTRRNVRIVRRAEIR